MISIQIRTHCLKSLAQIKITPISTDFQSNRVSHEWNWKNQFTSGFTGCHFCKMSFEFNRALACFPGFFEETWHRSSWLWRTAIKWSGTNKGKKIDLSPSKRKWYWDHMCNMNSLFGRKISRDRDPCFPVVPNIHPSPSRCQWPRDLWEICRSATSNMFSWKLNLHSRTI